MLQVFGAVISPSIIFQYLICNHCLWKNSIAARGLWQRQGHSPRVSRSWKAARGRCEGRWVMTLEPHPTRVTCRYGVLRVLGVVLVAAGLLSYFLSAFRKCHSIYIGSYYPSYPTYSPLNHPGDREIRELGSYISQHAAKRHRSCSRCLYRTNRPRLQCPSIPKV